MRRWNPLFLVALLLVVMATVVSITPAGASAHSFPSSISLIKGKIVAKNSNTHYFVLSFTCSPSSNTGNWTYEVDSTSSFTGMVNWTSCPFSSTGGQVTLHNGTGTLVGCGAPCNITPPTPNPTLTLDLTNIVATKTFFNMVGIDPTTNNSALCTSLNTPPCLNIKASGFNGIPDFSSQVSMGSGFPFATLNLSTR